MVAPSSGEIPTEAHEHAAEVVAIEARRLTKHFGPVHAVDDVSFTIRAGGITGFLGPNGAGKTTILRMLLGLVQPTRGEAAVWGRPYTALPNRGSRVGAVIESAGMNPGHRVRAHLRVRAAAGGIGRASVEQALELVGLGSLAERRIAGLSLGERQRVALAGALLGDPDLLILDEPANGLDPEGVRWLRAFLRQFAARGHTIVLSSHLLSEVAQTADDVLILNHGRLVVHASVATLTATAGTDSLEEAFLRLTSPTASAP